MENLRTNQATKRVFPPYIYKQNEYTVSVRQESKRNCECHYLSSLGYVCNTFHVFITEANLAPEACIQARAVAREAMKGFSVKLLAGRLMLKLVIFTQPHVTRETTKQSSSVFPHHTLTLYACCIHKRTCAGMGSQTFS